MGIVIITTNKYQPTNYLYFYKEKKSLIITRLGSLHCNINTIIIFLVCFWELRRKKSQRWCPMRAACIANIIQGGRKTFLLSVQVYNHQETNKARKLHKVDEKNILFRRYRYNTRQNFKRYDCEWNSKAIIYKLFHMI